MNSTTPARQLLRPAAASMGCRCRCGSPSRCCGPVLCTRVLEQTRMEPNRAPKDHIDIRILQTMIFGISLTLALEPECQILMFMWSVGPPPEEGSCNRTAVSEGPVLRLHGLAQVCESMQRCSEIHLSHHIVLRRLHEPLCVAGDVSLAVRIVGFWSKTTLDARQRCG